MGTAQDDAKAQTKLGTDYLLGRGVEQDRDQGFKLIRGAAEKGGAEAQRILGNLYEYGVGAPINLKESAKWRRKAAGQGDGKAARALGNMYLAGQGVSADKSLAFLWMRRAAEQGDPEGQAALGDMYGAGSGVTKNPEQAARWHQQAAASPGVRASLSADVGAAVERLLTTGQGLSALRVCLWAVEFRVEFPAAGLLPRVVRSLVAAGGSLPEEARAQIAAWALADPVLRQDGGLRTRALDYFGACPSFPRRAD